MKYKVIASILALASLAFGQSSFTTTTLAAAVADTSSTSITVASATGFTAGSTSVYIDRELMYVVSVSGTVIGVRRGSSGTRAATHPTASVARVGNTQLFGSFERSGSCTSTNEVILPVFDVNTGRAYSCINSLWTETRSTGVGALSTGTVVTTITAASNQTYTAAQVTGGMFLRNTSGAGRTDTLPTATLLIAAIPGAKVGSSLVFTVRNTAGAAETITIAAGTGGTISGTATIAQSNSKQFLVVIDGVASPAYTAYSLGTVVH
jgi:hypothetical protein